MLNYTWLTHIPSTCSEMAAAAEMVNIMEALTASCARLSSCLAFVDSMLLHV